MSCIIDVDILGDIECFSLGYAWHQLSPLSCTQHKACWYRAGIVVYSVVQWNNVRISVSFERVMLAVPA